MPIHDFYKGREAVAASKTAQGHLLRVVGFIRHRAAAEGIVAGESTQVSCPVDVLGWPYVLRVRTKNMGDLGYNTRLALFRPVDGKEQECWSIDIDGLGNFNFDAPAAHATHNLVIENDMLEMFERLLLVEADRE